MEREAEREIAGSTRPAAIIYPCLTLASALGTNFYWDHPRLVVFLVITQVLLGVMRMRTGAAVLQEPPPPNAYWLFRVSTVLVAVHWGLYTCLSMHYYGMEWTSQLITLISVGLTAGATALLAPDLWMLTLYTAALLLPAAASQWLAGAQGHYMAVIFVVYTLFARATAKTHNKRFWTSLRNTALLEEKAQQLESANRAKSDFLATMSHEIRTPMNAVFGFTELLLETPLNENQRQWSETIRTSCESLLSIISNVLDLSKIEAGRLDLADVPFPLKECLTSSVELFRAGCLQRGNELECDIPLLCPDVVRGDPGRLRQILVNLIGNAVKFTSEGTVRVSLQVLPDNMLEFRVQDTGKGIPSDKLDQLFEPFYQVDSSLSRAHEGTGLGLVICRRLLELMEGRIWVCSHGGVGGQPPADFTPPPLERGTLFGFQVRLAPEENRAVSQERTYDTNRLQALHILVVEDNPVNQTMIMLQLKKIGYEADLAENGLEALTACGHSTYDCIFMDLQMPDLDGLSCTRKIRQMALEPQPWIVALTANAFEEDRKACYEAGMNDYLSKPIRSADVKAALARCVDVQLKPKTPA